MAIGLEIISFAGPSSKQVKSAKYELHNPSLRIRMKAESDFLFFLWSVLFNDVSSENQCENV
jgi:hypothetical protein